MYVVFDYTCRWRDLIHTFIHKIEWNRADTSVYDPFSIQGMSVCHPFNSCSIFVFCFLKTVDHAMESKWKGFFATYCTVENYHTSSCTNYVNTQF